MKALIEPRITELGVYTLLDQLFGDGRQPVSQPGLECFQSFVDLFQSSTRLLEVPIDCFDVPVDRFNPRYRFFRERHAASIRSGHVSSARLVPDTVPEKRS
jgi:hypothetical protein